MLFQVGRRQREELILSCASILPPPRLLSPPTHTHTPFTQTGGLSLAIIVQEALQRMISLVRSTLA